MKPPHRHTLWAVGWAMLATILWLSLAPLPENTLAVPGSDKLAHCAAWLAVSLWFLLLICQPGQRIWWLTAFVLTGGLIEIAQSFTPYRHGDWLDFAANSAGVLIAWLVLPVAWRLKPVAWLFQSVRHNQTT